MPKTREHAGFHALRPCPPSRRSPTPSMSGGEESDTPPEHTNTLTPRNTIAICTQYPPVSFLAFHPVASNPIQSYPIPPHPITCYLTPSNPIHSNPIPSQSIPSNPIQSHLIVSYGFPAHPTPSHLIQSDLIPSHPIPSHLIPSNPIPSRLIPSGRLAGDARAPDVWPQLQQAPRRRGVAAPPTAARGGGEIQPAGVGSALAGGAP